MIHFHNIYKQAVLKETPLIINNLQLTISGAAIQSNALVISASPLSSHP